MISYPPRLAKMVDLAVSPVTRLVSWSESVRAAHPCFAEGPWKKPHGASFCSDPGAAPATSLVGGGSLAALALSSRRSRVERWRLSRKQISNPDVKLRFFPRQGASGLPDAATDASALRLRYTCDITVTAG